MKEADTAEDDKERKRREIRERLEAQMNRTRKKGFMTPERKNALRQLLRRRAADELKRQQELKAEERKKIIEERAGKPKVIKDANEATLIAICKEYYDRIVKLNEQKFLLETTTFDKECQIKELSEKVNDVRGRFIIPPLKKVSKTANQLEKMRQWTMKLAKMDMKGCLRPVKKDFLLETKEGKKEDKPEWLAAKEKPMAQMF